MTIIPGCAAFITITPETKSVTLNVIYNNTLLMFSGSMSELGADVGIMAANGVATFTGDPGQLYSTSQEFNILFDAGEEAGFGGVLLAIGSGGSQCSYAGAGVGISGSGFSGTGSWSRQPPPNQVMHLALMSSTGAWAQAVQIPGGFSAGSNFTFSAVGNLLYAAWRGAGSDLSIYYQSFNPATGGWAAHANIPGANSNTGWLGSAVFNGSLYVAWAGLEEAVWYSSMSPSGAWTGPIQIAGAYTSTGPALAVFNNQLYAIWQGAGGDLKVYYASMSAGGEWAAHQPIPGANDTPGGVAVAAFNNQLYALWVGVGTSAPVYYSAMAANGTWSQLASIPGANSSTGPALAVYNNQLLAVWKGVVSDNRIFYASLPANGSWSATAIVTDPDSNMPDPQTQGAPALSACGNQLFLGWVT